MTAIKVSTEQNQTRNWDTFHAKYKNQYPTVISYIQKELIDQYKEQIIRY